MTEKIHSIVTSQLGNSYEIKRVSPLAGGDINKVFQIDTNHESFCIKINSKDSFPKMFEKEALGLGLIESMQTINTPKVIAAGTYDELQYLLLEFIHSGSPSSTTFKVFGEKLAELHKTTNTRHGLDHDNFIGSLFQSNRQHNKWSDFFIEERINPQLTILFKNQGEIIDLNLMDRFYKNLSNYIEEEPSSLLHGDLWSGNYMIDERHNPVLYDPAVYFGHREMDIAMTKLFGGFPQEFYESYQYHYPLTKGWKDRIEIFQLYPLLVHSNLFGGSYLQSARNIIFKYT